MTLTLKMPGTAASSASLPTQRDFIADLANDSRVIGIWRLNSDYATLSGSDVTEFANLKTGGTALTSTSYRGQLATDNIIGRSVLSCAKADPVQYELSVAMASYASTGFTAFVAGRFLNDDDRLAYTNGTNYADIRTASGGGNSQVKGFLSGSHSATVVRTKDVRRLSFATFVLDSSSDISMEVEGETTVTATTAVVQDGTTFYLGSQNGALAPEANFDMFALFGVDINATANADLKAIWQDFLSSVYD